MSTNSQPDDGRAPAGVSIRGTAIIFARSTSWVRDQITAGHLAALPCPTGPAGSIMVSISSIRMLLARMTGAPSRSPSRPPAPLRLVWINPDR